MKNADTTGYTKSEMSNSLVIKITVKATSRHIVGRHRSYADKR